MTILVIDVGTSSVRVATVDDDGHVTHHRQAALLPDSPAPGLVEFDALRMAGVVLELAETVLRESGRVAAVGIANQRASTIVWERRTGQPVGPALGWQDLRTLGTCLTLGAEGVRVMPNQSLTKLAWLLDTYDVDRARDLCFGTVDTWIAWILSNGELHVTDASNAAVTGLLRADGVGWNDGVLERLRIPAALLPEVIDSTGIVGDATALPGAPPIAGLAGDQQASLIGQACVRPGRAKITFGTGGMLDLCLGSERPAFADRGGHGSFPIVAWRRDGTITWGVEAIMLSAGTNIEWLRDDLGLLATASESHDIAASCADSEGVVYVPALLGLGSPYWDYGARGTLLGLTRGSTRAHVVRAVLEGVAHRGADLVEAAEGDTGLRIETLRVDGGMSANPTFIQALADAAHRPVEVSPIVEATTLGAAFLAGMAVGVWDGLDDVAATWRPRQVVEPRHGLDRDRWHDAVTRARRWIPGLSALDF